MTIAVTLVTARAASADDLTDADYRDIYDELRSKASLDKFVTVIGSAVSKAWWSKYERYEAVLTRHRRAELRAAVGLPALPPAVADVLAAVDPNATIYQIGASAPDRLIMVAIADPLTLRLNGSLHILDDAADETHVTPVTRPRDRSSYAGLSMRRETKNRLNAARLRSGQTWDEFFSYWASLLEDPD